MNEIQGFANVKFNDMCCSCSKYRASFVCIKLECLWFSVKQCYNCARTHYNYRHKPLNYTNIILFFE